VRLVTSFAAQKTFFSLKARFLQIFLVWQKTKTQPKNVTQPLPQRQAICKNSMPESAAIFLLVSKRQFLATSATSSGVLPPSVTSYNARIYFNINIE